MIIDIEFWIFNVVVFLAYSVGSITGFGAMVIAVTLGAHLYDVEFLIPVLVPLNLITCIYLATRYRGQIDRDELLKRIAPISVIGMPVGLLVFFFLPQRSLQVLFGGFVLIYALIEIFKAAFKSESGEKKYPMWKGAGWLFTGGVMQGMYGTGGPMLVIYSNKVLKDKAVFRSTMATLFLILNSVLLIGHLIAGSATLFSLGVSARLIIPLALGIALGEFAHRKLSESKFRYLILVLLIAAGAALIIRTT